MWNASAQVTVSQIIININTIIPFWISWFEELKRVLSLAQLETSMFFPYASFFLVKNIRGKSLAKKLTYLVGWKTYSLLAMNYRRMLLKTVQSIVHKSRFFLRLWSWTNLFHYLGLLFFKRVATSWHRSIFWNLSSARNKWHYRNHCFGAVWPLPQRTSNVPSGECSC